MLAEPGRRRPGSAVLVPRAAPFSESVADIREKERGRRRPHSLRQWPTRRMLPSSAPCTAPRSTAAQPAGEIEPGMCLPMDGGIPSAAEHDAYDSCIVPVEPYHQVKGPRRILRNVSIMVLCKAVVVNALSHPRPLHGSVKYHPMEVDGIAQTLERVAAGRARAAGRCTAIRSALGSLRPGAL
jgi:hypothetical protein